MFCKIAFNVPLDREFDYRVPDELALKVVPGLRVTAPFGRVLTGGVVTAVSEVCTAPETVQIKPISAVADDRPLFGSDLFPLAHFMKSRWGGPIGQILAALLPPYPYFKPETDTASVHINPHAPDFKLTASQTQALKTLRALLAKPSQPVLLSGPCFTGKTEVVLRVAAEALNGYGQILLLVPDVAAADLLVAPAQERFGADNVFCWHSRTLLSKRKRIFGAVSSGRPCVVISTRSGTLLPFKNLRFIAMLNGDDDHYKQEENKPYYHAGDIAAFRADIHNALLVHASATPAAEIADKVRKGQVTEIKLTEPVPSHAFVPQIKITGKKSERSRYFSAVLLEQLQINLQRKETSLLIFDRRGHAQTAYCLNCGAYAKCKKCGTILQRVTGEDGTAHLHCKKCGADEPMEQKCPHCQNLIFKVRSGGTQKITAEIEKIFPQAKLLRLDSDSLRNKSGQGFEALDALRTGRADIIVGTRLASGALRGAKITLAAVVDGEMELDSPDFRASEKYGQMLFELRGRLSGVPNGRLIVQTADPEGYDYENLISGDYGACADAELLLRESFVYPPFIKLAKVTLKAKDFTLLQQETQRLRRTVASLCHEVLGPVWCAKKTDVFKKQYLLFKIKEENYLDVLARLDSFVPAKKAEIQLTADPYNFY